MLKQLIVPFFLKLLKYSRDKKNPTLRLFNSQLSYHINLVSYFNNKKLIFEVRLKFLTFNSFFSWALLRVANALLRELLIGCKGGVVDNNDQILGALH